MRYTTLDYYVLMSANYRVDNELIWKRKTKKLYETARHEQKLRISKYLAQFDQKEKKKTHFSKIHLHASLLPSVCAERIL